MFGMGSNLYEYSDEEEELGKVYDRVLMKRLLSYLKPYTLQLIIICLPYGRDHPIAFGWTYSYADWN